MTTSGTRVDDITRAFGTWVREQRRARGISQAKLAKASGPRILPTQIARIETGERPATISEAARICAVFGVALPDLTVELPDICAKCGGTPPLGFTCNTCGVTS